ncbi:hypothetical protein SOVF_108330 [Spinacia oleracea]|nr:hypothetical protein SOVF_108330 [Spinacia oleracea]
MDDNSKRMNKEVDKLLFNSAALCRCRLQVFLERLFLTMLHSCLIPPFLREIDDSKEKIATNGIGQ